MSLPVSLQNHRLSHNWLCSTYWAHTKTYFVPRKDQNVIHKDHHNLFRYSLYTLLIKLTKYAGRMSNQMASPATHKKTSGVLKVVFSMLSSATLNWWTSVAESTTKTLRRQPTDQRDHQSLAMGVYSSLWVSLVLFSLHKVWGTHPPS